VPAPKDAFTEARAERDNTYDAALLILLAPDVVAVPGDHAADGEPGGARDAGVDEERHARSRARERRDDSVNCTCRAQR
jgi:hypothetical protein